jgi:uncharacterized protein YeeX (DUF496 family)
MIPKPTEDTITNLLVKELERYGVKAETFPTLSTPSGIRKPDVWCVNAGAYPVEAKFRERDLINAIAKVQNDYIRWYDVLGIKGGFALLYPEKLTERLPPDIVAELAYKVKFKAVAIFPPKDTRKSFTVYEGTLPEIAKILAEHVLTPPEYVEPSTDYIIKALRDSAMYITLTLKYLSGKELEDIFGGKEVFKNILQYEEKKYPVETLRLASAYLLINQLLFYHVLSRRMPDKFPEIDADRIKRPADLSDYFKNVLNVNYRTVFSYDVASRIFSGFRDQIKAVINVIKGLGPEKVGGDLLGTIFHDLVPFEVRKSVAAFYTNVLAAELLAWLSVDRHDAKVADLAVGSGGLLVAAYRRKRQLLENERMFTAEDHRRFVEEELLGIDVMPFAANVAACHLALQSPEYFTNRVNVAIWDSTELLPGKNIPSIASLRFVLKGQTGLEMFTEPKAEDKGVVSLTGEAPEEIKLETYDVVIMNPPFTRQERIPEEYKLMLNERFKDYKEHLHGQLGYFGYFILLADRFLKIGGRMALVLPATILRIRSCEGIRKLLAKHYHIEYIITTWHRSAFSESVRFREILVVARKCKPNKKVKTKIAVLKELPRTNKQAREIAELLKDAKRDLETDKIVIKLCNYSKLRRDVKNWFKFISINDLELVEIFDELLKADKLEKLASISDFIRGYELRGGLVTGLIVNSSMSRALKSKDVWILLNEEREHVNFRHKSLITLKFKVPKKSLMRTIRRPTGIKTIDATRELDYVIVKPWDEREFSQLQKLASIEITDDLMSSISRDVENRMGNVFVVRRLNLSAPRTYALAFYSSKPAAPVKLLWSVRASDENAKILCLFFNSSINLLQSLLQRSETEGAFIGLSKYILNEFLVIDPSKLSQSEKKCLLRIFDQVAQHEMPCLLDQLKLKYPERRKIDYAFLKILGYKGDINELLDRLYESLAEEIIILKKMMAEKA